MMAASRLTLPVPECFAVRLGENVRLALPANSVREVAQVAWGDVCPLPGVPAALLGVVNRSGQLGWVLDLGLFLGLPGVAKEPLPLTVVVVTGGNRRLALAVTALEGIFTVAQPQPLPLPQQLQRRYRELLAGLVYRQREALALVLPETLLARLAEI
ncbi:MAG: chemotaxis protein CheW [Gloeomargarita sp. DG_2_bins_126]